MSKQYIFRAIALRDVEKITCYIANENLVAAENMRNEILKACEIIAENPYIGQERFDLTDRSVRFLAFHRNYMIIYSAISTPVQFLRIYNTARNIDLVLH
jgi:plasmid stabilization system protein ParE